MCIAFPKAGDGKQKSEPEWKSVLLLLPRMLGLAWLVMKILAGGLHNWLQEKRHSAA